MLASRETFPSFSFSSLADPTRKEELLRSADASASRVLHEASSQTKFVFAESSILVCSRLGAHRSDRLQADVEGGNRY
jgi:hypothetical protein